MNNVVRIYIEKDTCDMADLETELDNRWLDYDFDSGDRLMISEDDLEDVENILYDLGAEFDVI